MMRRRFSFLVFFVAILLQHNCARAWNAAGHKLIASIAFSQLSPNERQKIVSILRKHPRFEEDFDGQMPKNVEDENEWIFQQAAIWPDLARQFPEPFKTQYDRPNWHFYSKPLFLAKEEREALEKNITQNLSLDPPATPTNEMNVIQTIRYARRVLSSDVSSPKDKALFLAWLFHDVGEIHQPLNTTVLYSKALFPEGDRRRNGIKTDRSKSLRQFWDDCLGANANLMDVHREAASFVKHDRFEGGVSALNLDEEKWLEESVQASTDICYLPEILDQLREFSRNNAAEPTKLDEDYITLSRNIARYCVNDAGYRLGAVLKEIADK